MRKNIIFMAMVLMCLATGLKAENIGVDDFKITQGETIQVPVRFTNSHASLTAFSMELQLPRGLELVAVESTERFSGEVLFGNPDTNVYGIAGIGVEPIQGTEGDLLLLTFKASETFTGGVGTISEVEFISKERERVAVDGISFNIDYEKGSSVYLGDVDLSGAIDVTDVMVIVDYVLNKPLRSFSFVNADVNEDGIVDVSDAMIIVNIILGKI